MSNIINLSDTAANAEASALAPLMNSGTINLYSGTQPVNANTALTGGNTLLATLTFSSTAFGAPSGGVLTANAITAGTGLANGTATFARILKSDNTTVVMDAPVGSPSGFAINLSSTAIAFGASVAITSATFNVTET